MRRVVFLVFLFLVSGPAVNPPTACALDSLHASIMVHEDASVTITETIHIESGDTWFRNEFDRNLPSARTKIFGLRYSKGFQLLECLRDGIPESCKVFGEGNLLVRVGDFMNSSPVSQVRTYTLKYRLDNQIISEAAGDRFTWTVTEKNWGWWPIEVSASVKLPGESSAKLRAGRMLISHEGRENSDMSEAAIDRDGLVHFAAPRTLSQDEVFSISLGWPEGYIKRPAFSSVVRQLAADNKGIVLGFGWLAVLVVYYVLAWMVAGRGPATGTIVISYDPPRGMSPAVIRYIRNMGYDDRCFTASLLNIAAKGHLQIRENDDRQYRVTRSQGSVPLSEDETKIMDQLPAPGRDFNPEIEDQRMAAAATSHANYLRINFEKAFFVGNLRYFGVGLVISSFMVMATGLGYLDDPAGVVLFILGSFFLTIFSPPAVVAIREFLKRWKAALASGGAKGVRIARAVVFTVAAALICQTSYASLSMLVDMTSPYILVFFAAAVLINYAFYELMKAPTRAGRKLHDDIEGFREFLRMTEHDRMKLLDPPDRTPELFNRYLPYALALDLEQTWSEQFSDILAGAALGSPGSSLELSNINIVSFMGNLLRQR